MLEISCSRVLSSNSIGDKTFVSYKVSLGDEGVSVEDAKDACAILGLEVDQATLANAFAGGVIGETRAREERKSIRARYSMVLAEHAGLVEGGNEEV